MRVSCPRCQNLLAGTDLNVAASTAVCRACGEFFSLPSPGSTRPTVASLETYLPDDLPLTVSTEGDTTVLTLRPSPRGMIFQGFFALIWCGFLGFWYSAALPRVGSAGGWLFVLFPLLHVGVGLKMVYGVLGQLLNATRVRLGSGGLSVATRPLPWGRGVRASLEQVDGFGVFDATSRGGSGTPTPDWQVQLLRSQGTSSALQLGLRSPAHAQYVADLLNARLNELREAPGGYRS